MIKILKCRRSSIALLGMTMLWSLGFFKGMDISTPLAAICMGVAAANAGQAVFKKEVKSAE